MGECRIVQIREGLAVMHDEHVPNHSSKNSSEIIQSKEIKDVNVNSTSSHVIIVHDTTSSAMETIPNQDKQHEHNVHCPVGNSDRPLTEIIELCEDVISIDPDNGLNKTLQENCTLLKPPTEDQQSVTLKTTHCNEAAKSGCEINTITNLTNGESLAPETYQPNEELSHSMPAKTVNSTLKTQSEKSGPSEQVRAKSSELILGQTPKQNTANKVKGHKSIKYGAPSVNLLFSEHFVVFFIIYK